MYRLGQCTLRYVHQTTDNNYNPIIEIEDRIVKCSLMDTFSLNYYQNQTRDMRNSKNIVVAKNHLLNVEKDNKFFQLEYVLFGNKKFKIMNILKDRKSSLKAILDCQEVINE